MCGSRARGRQGASFWACSCSPLAGPNLSPHLGPGLGDAPPPPVLLIFKNASQHQAVLGQLRDHANRACLHLLLGKAAAGRDSWKYKTCFGTWHAGRCPAVFKEPAGQACTMNVHVITAGIRLGDGYTWAFNVRARGSV